MATYNEELTDDFEDSSNLWIDNQRNFTECDEHWSLRRRFLKQNFHNLKKTRLLCYSQLYVNMQILGCRYNKEVTERVNQLAAEGGITYEKKSGLQRILTLASSAAKTKLQEISAEDRGTERKSENVTHYRQFVSEGTSSPNVQTQSSQNQIKSEQTKRKLDEMSTSDEPLKQTLRTNNCRVVPRQQSHFENRLIPTNIPDFSSKPNIQIPKENPLNKFGASGLQFLSQKVFFVTPSIDIRQLLENFFSKNSIKNTMKTVALSNNKWSGCIHINLFGGFVQMVNTPGEVNTLTALRTASKEMVIHLSQICRTIVKRRVHMANKEDKISLGDTPDKQKESAFEYKPIDNQNFGLKMMKMMGWTGGGLGIHEDGIVEPVKAYDGASQQGIGFTNKVNIKEVRDILQKYMCSNVLEDLIFSPDISKGVRAQIHQVVRKIKRLTSASYNESGKRYLTVKKIIPPEEMAKILVAQGGELGRFKLFYPGDIDFSKIEGTVISAEQIPL